MDIREAYKYKRVYGDKVNEIERKPKNPVQKEYDRVLKELKDASNRKR